MKRFARKMCGLFLAMIMTVTLLPGTNIYVKAEIPENVFVTQPGGDYGISVVDERSGKSKGKVSFTLSFDPSAVEVINYNTKKVIWSATRNQVNTNKKTWENVELPASSVPYQVRAWYQSGGGPYFVGSYLFNVTNCIRNVQVWSVGSVQTEEDFVYENFSDMTPYGANYGVNHVTWLEYAASDTTCDPASPVNSYTLSKAGDKMKCQKGKKYRLKINVSANEKSVFDKKDANQGITVGEGQQFEMVLVNGGSWAVDTDYSGTTADNVLEIVTEPIDTSEEPAFLQQPAAMTAVEPGKKSAVVNWAVNYVQKKIQVIYGEPAEGKIVELEGDCNTIGFNIHSSHAGETIRIRSFFGDGENDYIESQTFRVAEYIRDISINGLIKPVEGETPQLKDSFSVAGDAPYTIKVAGWIKEGSSDAVTKFERPGTYYACILLAPKAGYIFDTTDNTGRIKSVYINNKKDLADQGGCQSLNQGNILEVYSMGFEFADQWTVTFDPNGGTGTMDPMKVDKGKEIILPWNYFTAPEAGKVFVGWQLGDDSEHLYHELAKAPIAADTVVKPVWDEKETVTVTFQAGENATGETVERKMVNQTVVSFESTEMGGFAPAEGCKFIYWSVQPEGKQEFRVAQANIDANVNNGIEIQGNTTITYVCAAPEKYTLRYDKNGDTVTGTMDNAQANPGEEIVLAECAFAHPDGKRFLGWIVSEDVETPQSSELKKPGEAIAYTTNCVAKAKWSAKGYWTIDFDANGGSGDAYTDYVVRGDKYKVPVCTFTAPEGKVFDKWEISEGNYAAAGDKIDITANTIFKAIWKEPSAEEFNVTFDPNGGTGDMPAVKVKKDEKYKLPACGFTPPAKDGDKEFEFDRWDIGETGQPGEEVEITADTKIKAVWKTVAPPHKGFAVELSSNKLPYTGIAVMPEVTVYDDAAILKEGIDYTLTYKNNVKISKKASVTVKFIGNYTGKAITEPFEITTADISKSQTVPAEGMVGSTEKDLKPVLYFGGAVLKEKTDYELDYTGADFTTPGEKTIKVKGKGAFAGSETTVPLKLYDKTVDRKALSDKSIKIKTKSVTIYDNDPVPEVTDGKTALKEDVDYTVKYWGKPGIGTAYLTITGKGKYVGSKSATYKVNKVNLKDLQKNKQITITVNEGKDVPFMKGGVKPSFKVTVSYGGNTTELKEDSYKVAYNGNKAKGNKASVKITGRGYFTGTASQNFTIVDKDISELKDTCFVGDIESTAAKIDAYKKVKVAVFDTNGTELKEKTDYTLEWTAPVSGEATVTVKGTNKGYTGSFSKTYRVIDAGTSIQKAKVSVLDANSKAIKAFIYKGTQIVPGQTDGTLKAVTSGKGGKELKLGEDYEIAGCVNNLNKGNGILILKGKGTNCGLITYKFKINAKTLKK